MSIIRHVDSKYCLKPKYNATKCGGKRLLLNNDKKKMISDVY